MRERDRLILIVGVVLAVLVATWMFWVSPERKAAASVEQQVASAQSTLSTAESQLQTAQSNKAKYATAYTALVGVGKAVPASAEVPSLIYELDQASNLHDVEFTSITAGGGGGSGSTAAPASPAPSSSSSTSSSTASSTAAAAATALPFTFEFDGTFFDLYHLLGRLNSFAVQTKNGSLIVTGRLLTIQGAQLAPASTSTTTASGPSAQILHGTITASAYMLPAATPTAASSSGGSSTTTPSGTTATGTPAVIPASP
jgi:hypothetical protein